MFATKFSTSKQIQLKCPYLRFKNAAAAGVVVKNEMLWVTGGEARLAGSNTPTKLKSTEIFKDGNWTRGPDLPEARAYHCMVQIDDHTTFLAGGK